MGNFNFATDCKVTCGEKITHIDFDINLKNTSAQQLASQGYQINGGSAAKDVPCKTATYTFTKLPTTLEELKTIPRDTMFAPFALGICAMASYEELQGQHMYDHPVYDLFDYINGPNFKISQVEKSGIWYSMKATLEKGKYCYFDGAAPTNQYTPNQPFTFTLEEGPYYIPAKEHDIVYGTTPDRYMVLISFAGDDSKRYMDVYRSSDGNWYCWNDSWKHLIAGIKEPAIKW